MIAFSRKKSFRLIALLTLAISGPFYAFFLFYRIHHHLCSKNEEYQIRSIVQTGPVFEALKTTFLAETLGLCCDKAQNIMTFDLKRGELALLNTHVIKSARLLRLKPSSLFVDYTVREPIAIVSDMSNTLIDEEGVLFPAFPFYTPQRLPAIYFGLGDLKWGSSIAEEKMQLVRELLKLFQGNLIEKIDLYHSQERSYGKREMVVEMKNKAGKRTLRLGMKNYLAQIENYLLLEKEVLCLQKGECVIDLRLSGVACIKALQKPY